MRRTRNVVLLALCGLVIAMGGIWAYDRWQHAVFVRRSPIVADLLIEHMAPGDFIRKSLQGKLSERFPIGSPLSDLLDTLAAQGFQEAKVTHIDTWRKDGKGSSGALALDYGRVFGLCCKQSWLVIWVADENHRIAQIVVLQDGTA